MVLGVIQLACANGNPSSTVDFAACIVQRKAIGTHGTLSIPFGRLSQDFWYHIHIQILT